MKRGGYVYILANKIRSVLYVGVTSDLRRRISEHKEKLDPLSFTAKYNCDLLVYYYGFHHIEEAIGEEKRIKGGSRVRKLKLINDFNPEWKDLYEFIED